MIDIGSIDEFADGRITIVAVKNKELGIIRRGQDTVYAILNRCPHMGGPLCEGHLGPLLEGPPGDVRTRAGELVISCPWHHWEFYVKTGRSLFADDYRAKTYPTRIDQGRVVVDV